MSISSKGTSQRYPIHVKHVSKAKVRSLFKDTFSGCMKSKDGIARFRANPLLDFDEFIDFCKTLNQLANLNGFPVPDKVESKIPSLHPKQVEDKTYSVFLDAERQCFLTNANMRDPSYVLKIRPYLDEASRIIDDILGRATFRKSNKFYTGHGVSIRGGGSKPFQTLKADMSKLSHLYGRKDLISEFFDLDLSSYLNEIMIHCDIGPDLITQVPKKCDVNRTIGITSTVLKAEQHTIGVHLRRCFARYHGDNVDHNLDTVADYHTYLAWYASKTMLYDTFDMHAASDTISYQLVRLLMSQQYKNSYKIFTLMEQCRARCYVLKRDMSIKQYYKYCAMGNGFCFELESIIFYALTKARYLVDSKADRPKFLRGFAASLRASAKEISTFGDDIIVPYCYSKESWVEYYRYFGFTMNLEKSFSIESYFRESCGSDFINGLFVRGFYLKTRSLMVTDFLRAVNFYKLNYNVTDEQLSALPFYRKTVSCYNLKQCSVNQYLIVGRDQPFFKDVPTSFLLCDNIGCLRFIFKLIERKRTRWQQEQLTSDAFYLLKHSEESETDLWVRRDHDVCLTLKRVYQDEFFVRTLTEPHYLAFFCKD